MTLRVVETSKVTHTRFQIIQSYTAKASVRGPNLKTSREKDSFTINPTHCFAGDATFAFLGATAFGLVALLFGLAAALVAFFGLAVVLLALVAAFLGALAFGAVAFFGAV